MAYFDVVSGGLWGSTAQQAVGSSTGWFFLEMPQQNAAA